jgi:hypothetical protein
MGRRTWPPLIVKQLRKFASFASKERQNGSVLISILLFLEYLPPYLTGKMVAESGKNWKLIYRSEYTNVTESYSYMTSR